jgi:glycosyltransferase involved in cell wall biosynthesis
MRILYLTCMFPLPANNGVRMRMWALLRALAANGHDIRLMCLAHPDEVVADDQPLREICSSIDVVPLAFSSSFNSRNYVERLMKAFSPQPFGVSRFRSPQMASLIAARSLDADAILADTCYPLANVPRLVDLPLILDNHNVEHVLVRRYLEQEKNPVKYAYAWMEYLKLRKWEQAACERSAVVLVCSDQDRAILQSLCPSITPVVVPNVIDVETYMPVPESDPKTIIYSGTMDWFPNRDAVEYFVHQILPRVRQRVPGVRLIVAGRTAPEEFRKQFAEMPDVEFTGTVPDMRVEIGKASVCVVPLRIGSGTRLKILEAAAMGKPVVSTSVGAEGLDFQNEREIILADDPEEFARAVAGLIENRTRREQLGACARQRVVESYSFSSLRESLRTGLEPLSNNSRVVVG